MYGISYLHLDDFWGKFNVDTYSIHRAYGIYQKSPAFTINPSWASASAVPSASNGATGLPIAEEASNTGDSLMDLVDVFTRNSAVSKVKTMDYNTLESLEQNTASGSTMFVLLTVVRTNPQEQSHTNDIPAQSITMFEVQSFWIFKAGRQGSGTPRQHTSKIPVPGDHGKTM